MNGRPIDCDHCSSISSHFICLWTDSQDNEERLLASLGVSVRQSVRLSIWKNSSHSGRIFIKFKFQGFENLPTNSCMNTF